MKRTKILMVVWWVEEMCCVVSDSEETGEDVRVVEERGGTRFGKSVWDIEKKRDPYKEGMRPYTEEDHTIRLCPTLPRIPPCFCGLHFLLSFQQQYHSSSLSSFSVA